MATRSRTHCCSLQAHPGIPKGERSGLTGHLRRDATSVAATIVEGSTRHSERDQLQFRNISEASLRETEDLLRLARELAWMSRSISH